MGYPIYPIGVPIGVPLKKYRLEKITVKELKANIHCWSGKKLPKCTKKLQILVSIKRGSHEITASQAN